MLQHSKNAYFRCDIIMGKIISFLRDKHSEIYKGFLFLLSIALIVYLLPKEGKFKYEYQNLRDKPWPYETLFAPFDFAIKKTKEEVDAEKSEISKTFTPFYVMDTTVYPKKIKDYYRAFEEKWPTSKYFNRQDNPVFIVGDSVTGRIDHIKYRHFIFGKQLLDSIFTRGVIQVNDVIEDKTPDFSIYLKTGAEAKERELG